MIKWKDCPQCKNRLKLQKEYPYCNNCKLSIYLHSAPTAGVLIIDKGKVLLSKRAIEPFMGKYDIIGGFLQYGEDPITGVIRETKEETGLTIRVQEMLGIYMDNYGPGGDSTLNINYIGTIIGGKMKAHDDVASLEWFPINNLPKPAFKSQLQTFKDLRNWSRKNKQLQSVLK